MLESNPEWDLGGFHVIKFNANNETVTMGLHSGAANFYNVCFHSWLSLQRPLIVGSFVSRHRVTLFRTQLSTLSAPFSTLDADTTT
jgi:hypothetical protein